MHLKNVPLFVKEILQMLSVIFLHLSTITKHDQIQLSPFSIVCENLVYESHNIFVDSIIFSLIDYLFVVCGKLLNYSVKFVSLEI